MNIDENVIPQFFVKTVGEKGTKVETLGPCPSPELLNDLITYGGAHFSKDELNAIERAWAEVPKFRDGRW